MRDGGRKRVRKKLKRELQAKDTWYPRLIKELEQMNHRAETGKIVVRAKETPWMQNRNAKVRYYFMPYKTDTALQTMQAFEHVIHRHSGKHRHQGGLAIFVLDGTGYTLVDGKRHDWKAGDLILLPIRPGGVEHQHFNSGSERALLLCASPSTYLNLGVGGFEQLERRIEQRVPVLLRDGPAAALQDAPERREGRGFPAAGQEFRIPFPSPRHGDVDTAGLVPKLRGAETDEAAAADEEPVVLEVAP